MVHYRVWDIEEGRYVPSDIPYTFGTDRAPRDRDQILAAFDRYESWGKKARMGVYVAGTAAVGVTAGVASGYKQVKKMWRSKEDIAAARQVRAVKANPVALAHEQAVAEQNAAVELAEDVMNYNEVTIDMEGELGMDLAPEGGPVVHNLNMAANALQTTVFRPDNVGVLPGSRVENSVVRGVALVSKGKSNKRFRSSFEALQNSFFEALCPRVTLSEEGHDVVMSTNATGSARVGGAAAVFVKSFSLGDLAPMIVFADEAPSTGLAIADPNSRSYMFNMRHDYTWKNTTNCLAYFYYREHHASIDMDEAVGLLQCWNADLGNKRGYAGETNIATEVAALAATDVLGAGADSRNPSTWKIGQANSAVRTNWGQGSKWYCVVLPPGGVFQKSIVWHGSFTKWEYDRAIGTACKWLCGMPGLLCKVLGEELYNGESKEETTAETAGLANVYDPATGITTCTTLTTGPVQLVETVVSNCSLRVVPGYKKSVYNIGNRSNATAGINGIVADLPYTTAQRYKHVNGDGNLIQTYEDIGPYVTTLESLANQAFGADQGLRTVADAD